MKTPPEGWTLSSLTELFASDPEALGDVDVSVAEGSDVLQVTLKERGDLNVLIAASGDQILMSVALTPAADVPNRAAFDQLVLRTHKLVPLSTFGLTTIDRAEWYELFGSLSSQSLADVVVEEADVLASNALDAAEMISEWIANGGSTGEGDKS
ncbi:MAG: YjfI family protein [Hyphomicrobiaceae bacterium]